MSNPTLSLSNSYNQYINQLEKLFKLIEDAWYDFMINYNQTFIKMTETSYDSICKYICDTIKPIILKAANDLASQMEQQRKILQGRKYNIYS